MAKTDPTEINIRNSVDEIRKTFADRGLTLPEEIVPEIRATLFRMHRGAQNVAVAAFARKVMRETCKGINKVFDESKKS